MAVPKMHLDAILKEDYLGVDGVEKVKEVRAWKAN